MSRRLFGNKKPKVIVIVGTTAVGKSALAVKIAKKIDGEIISADSRQVYKGLDIGTGKITKKEMKGIPHHILDVVNPKKKFTVAEYQKEATSAIGEVIKRAKVPIICGGTGFYIDALTKGIVFPEVKPNLKLRNSLNKKTLLELFKILNKIDPKRAKDIKNKNELNNKVRLIRAIEIAKYLGRVPKIIEALPPYKFIKIGLFLPKDLLRKQIEKRVKGMFRQGLLKEIKKLKKEGVSDKRLQELGFEYFNPTYEKVVKETIRYTKRQNTWFKRDKEIKWLDVSKNINLDKLIKI
jgi:tRNA dimethylallyltransferase